MGACALPNTFATGLSEYRLSILDAYQVMRSGKIGRPPEQDIKTGSWKYRISGYTSDRLSIWMLSSALKPERTRS